jgi:hypothetical protein
VDRNRIFRARLTAFQHGTAVGGELLFAGDGVAGLHWLGVLLMRESIAIAASMGYEHLVLQANPDVVELSEKKLS